MPSGRHGSNPGKRQPFSASAADCTGVDRSSHVDSLRQLLALPDYVKLQWQSSNNGIDTLRVIDDFNRTEVGDHWARVDTAWQISNGELQVARDEACSWCYLALFLPVPYVKDLLGHADIGSTMVYVHSTPLALRAAVRKLAE